MEYLGGGEIKWRTDHDEPTLTLAQTRRIMRDAILGLEYCESFLTHQVCMSDAGPSALSRYHSP